MFREPCPMIGKFCAVPGVLYGSAVGIRFIDRRDGWDWGLSRLPGSYKIALFRYGRHVSSQGFADLDP